MFKNKEDFDDVMGNSMQHKLNNWYGTLRFSSYDAGKRGNFIPMKGEGFIAASDTVHMKHKLQILKPKEFLLFNSKPKGTSILNRLAQSRAALSKLNQIDQMSNLYVQGTSKFDSEVEFTKRVPEKGRYIIRNRDELKFSKPKNQLGETTEEILAANFESRVLY
jgi:hypothetical protein